MFLSQMKYRVQWFAALGALLVPASLSGTAFAAGRAPRAAHIRTAVQTAERSADLWATVNICNTRRHRNVIGIRGQIPSLGFTANLGMEIGVEYYSTADKTFKPVPGARKSIALGKVSRGLHQGGVAFPLTPHAGTLRGSVKFEWRLGSKVLGRVSRTTTGGHRNADFGDPARYSNGGCVIR
jgi:hypothetical protein